MRHKLLVLTVKKLLKSVYIYGRYRKINTGLSLFWTILYMVPDFLLNSKARRPKSVFVLSWERAGGLVSIGTEISDLGWSWTVIIRSV